MPKSINCLTRNDISIVILLKPPHSRIIFAGPPSLPLPLIDFGPEEAGHISSPKQQDPLVIGSSTTHMLAAKPSLPWRILPHRTRLPPPPLPSSPPPPSSLYIPTGASCVASRRFLRQRPRTALSPKELFSDIRRAGGNWRDVAEERRRQRLRGPSDPLHHRRGPGAGGNSSGGNSSSGSGKSADEEDELGDAQLSTNRGDYVPVVEHYVKFSLQAQLQAEREKAARRDATVRWGAKLRPSSLSRSHSRSLSPAVVAFDTPYLNVPLFILFLSLSTLSLPHSFFFFHSFQIPIIVPNLCAGFQMKKGGAERGEGDLKKKES